VEIWPAAAEVYFADERCADPVTAQVRFEAVVYNSPTSRVIWEVRDLQGNPGKGWVDAAGVYHAPVKGALGNATTEIVSATAADDPLRKAFASVTLVGKGPAEPVVPTLLLLPKVATIFYPPNATTGKYNDYMNPASTEQVFQAVIGRTEDREVIWTINSVDQAGYFQPWYRYQATGSGSGAQVPIKVRLKNHPEIVDTAWVHVINYNWPGIVA
jgi:hypothetical protein